MPLIKKSGNTLQKTAVGGEANVTNLQVLETAVNNKQPLDATLTALAGVSTAADKLIYATGADAFTTTTLSSFARTLIDDVDAATARTTLGAQASDATLTALAGVTTAADKLIYATGADTFATTALTSTARTLLDDTDVATMRATLGAAASGDFASSIATSGYQKLPGGLIIQWGRYGSIGSSIGGALSISFPLAFPNAVFSIVMTPNTTYNAGSSANYNSVTSYTTTGFGMDYSWQGYMWVAVGY